MLDYQYGDSAQAEAAFAGAAHVARLHLVNNRIVINAMEPRACVAAYEDGRFTLHAPTQSVLSSRAAAAEVMNVEPGQLRFVARNVGGSFGMKGAIFPEYICAMHAARELGRPVKWTDTRSESFLSDHHGRDHEFQVELALDAQGPFPRRARDRHGEHGRLPHGLRTAHSRAQRDEAHGRDLSHAARRSAHEMRTDQHRADHRLSRGRAAGGNYYLERLVDAAAREMNIDPVELRKRNHITPDQMPYKAPSGSVYDSGEFAAILDEALEEADYQGFPARERESASRGLWRGIGIGQFLEVTRRRPTNSATSNSTPMEA